MKAALASSLGLLLAVELAGQLSPWTRSGRGSPAPAATIQPPVEDRRGAGGNGAPKRDEPAGRPAPRGSSFAQKGIEVLLYLDPLVKETAIRDFLRETGSGLVLVDLAPAAGGGLEVRKAVLPDSTGLPRISITDSGEVELFLQSHRSPHWLWVELTGEAPAIAALLRASDGRGLIPHLLFAPSVAARLYRDFEARAREAGASLEGGRFIVHLSPDGRGAVAVTAETDIRTKDKGGTS